MAKKNVYIIAFEGIRPQWSLFDGVSLNPCPPPEGRAGLPVILLLPDRFFFYFQPEGLQAMNSRSLRKAALLQMRHYFPAGKATDIGIFPSGKGAILGYFTKPELKDFLEEHAELAGQANIITTSFILTHEAALTGDVDVWSWRGGEGERALYAEGQLFFFRGDEEEVRSRMTRQGLAPDAASPLLLGEVLTDIWRRNRSWSSYKLPIKAQRTGDARLPHLTRTAVAATLVGFLFIMGQGWRLSDANTQLAAQEEAIRAVYKEVLGPKPGNDPYGRLLYAVDKLQSRSTSGIDVLEVLEDLSRNAPPDLYVESMSTGSDSGTIMGILDDYDTLEKLLEALKSQARYSYTLEQATNTKTGIRITLKINTQ